MSDQKTDNEEDGIPDVIANTDKLLIFTRLKDIPVVTEISDFKEKKRTEVFLFFKRVYFSFAKMKEIGFNTGLSS